MIHLIVVLHFAVITSGVITLMLAWLQFKRAKDRFHKWFFYTDLIFTLAMILDAIRIYISKNVEPVPQVFWMFFGLFTYFLSTATIFCAANLCAATTQKLLPKNIVLVFFIAILAPAVNIIDNIFYISVGHNFISWIYALVLLSCTVFGYLTIPQAVPDYKRITITYTAATGAYLLIHILTGLVPGIPGWLIKLPYFQILYFVLSTLGLFYLGRILRIKNEAVENREISQKDSWDIEVWCKDYGLTERELEIICEIVDGRNNTEIGYKLFISPNTVKNHVYNIYKKIGIKNRYELMSLISRQRESRP